MDAESNDKETSTHTIMVFYLLQIGDEVKVKFHKVIVKLGFDP